MTLKKTLLIIAIVLLIDTFCFGQDFNQTDFSITSGVKVGFFDGIGGGPVLYQEFNYSLTDFIILSPKIQIGFANKTSETQFLTGTDFEVGLNLKFLPLPKKFNRLKLCFDFGTFKYSHRWASDILNLNNPNQDYEKEILNAPRTRTTKGFNFSYGIDLDLIKKDNIVVGLTGMINPIYQQILDSRDNNYNPNLYDFGFYSRIFILRNK